MQPFCSLAYQCHIALGLHHLATAIILQVVEVYAHILWQAVERTIPVWIRVRCLKHCLTPTVRNTEDVEPVVTLEDRTEMIVHFVIIRRERVRELYRATWLRIDLFRER